MKPSQRQDRVMKKDFIGTWRITKMSEWDNDSLDMEVKAFIRIDNSGSGEFQFGAVQGAMYGDFEKQEGGLVYDFTFEGSDEGDDVSGDGWMRMTGNKAAEERIRFHGWDKSMFWAKKAKAKMKKVKQGTGKRMLELFDEHADLFDSMTKDFTLIIDVLESIVKQLRITREVSDELKRELNAGLNGSDEAGFTKEAMKRILPRTAHLQKELKKMQGIEFNMMLFALPDKKGRKFYELVHELEEAGKMPMRDPAKKERIDNVTSSLEQYISEIKEMSKPFVPSKVNPDQTIILKVMFRHRKGTWRRIELRAADSLEDLHNMIQHAFGWDNGHLYSFFMDNKLKRGDFDMEYTCPYEPEGRKTADKAQLGMFGFSKAQKFAYLFDFGDEHKFEIEVLDFGIVDARKRYPLILESKGRAPGQYGGYDD